MSVYTCAEVAHIWVQAGGNPRAVINAVAVSTAESGRNNTAISSSYDYGLWQINRIHFGEYGINSGNWEQVLVNARAAIGISQNGTNWAPWCTCWTDPGPNCGHGYLPNPQPGSPAGNAVGFVVSQLGTGAGGPVNPDTTGPQAFESAWSTAGQYVGPWSKARNDSLQAARNTLGRLF